jgi:hypothetical protein
LAQGELANSETGSPNGINELFIGEAGPGVFKLVTNTGGAAAEPNDSGQDNQTLTTGTGIDGADGGDDTSFTMTLALDELGITSMSAGDWIAFDDAGSSSKALISAINLSLFNDDLGHVENATHTGQVTGATALILNPDATSITAQPASGAIIAADTILINDGGVLSEATFTQMITFFDANLSFGTVTAVTGGTGIDSSGGTTPDISLNLSELGVSVPVTGDWVAFDDAGTSSKALFSSIPLGIMDNSVSEFVSENDTMVVVDWNWVLDEDTMSSDSAIHVATQQSIKAYVDGAVTGGVVYKGGFDPTASAGDGDPDLDTITSVTGDMYTTTVAGTYNWTTGSAVLEIGDVLIAESDGVLNNVADWTIVQNNLGQADETTDGYVRIATQVETDLTTSTLDTAAITPMKLNAWVIDGGTF